jgi:hypothetical protein
MPGAENLICLDPSIMSFQVIARPIRMVTAYQIFVEERLNDNDIRVVPHRDRLAALSEKWRNLSQDAKDLYQARAEARWEAAVMRT